ncbi:MAG TPA: type II toxin-antitoxin system ParD family antitoxin [Alphaproteobacteria bacterium]|nr:type II toxin-antitoxin system ParD family antitoxin [Alphaproteobacteria bacterium]
MAEGVNVRFQGELQNFIHSRIGEEGLYNSASEYIRDLVRRDYEREEARKWAWLRNELKPGMEADESEFVKFDIEDILK